MKAMLLKGKNQPLVLETVPDPVPGPGEAVARVLACGAGLTIHHVRAGRVPVQYPRILGHEITAEIVATGAGVTRLKAGDAVTAYFYLTCGHCYWCRINRETLCENFGGYVGRECDGGYAEYIKLPAENFIPLPETMNHKKPESQLWHIIKGKETIYGNFRAVKEKKLSKKLIQEWSDFFKTGTLIEKQ